MTASRETSDSGLTQSISRQCIEGSPLVTELPNRQNRLTGPAVVPTLNSGYNLSSGVNPATNGWVEDAHFAECVLLCLPLDGMSGVWTVPPPPTNYVGQTIFLYIGEEDYDENQILQPVLQYGPSCAGGGAYWSIAVWYVWGSSCSAASWNGLPTVAVGDTVSGFVSCISSQCAEGTWVIGMQDSTTGAYVQLDVSDGVPAMYNAFVTLEVYSVTNCNQYPGTYGTDFYDLDVDGGTPGWINQFPDAVCPGDDVIASGSSNVWLDY